MSVYFYLTTNESRNEPDALWDVSYIHVKAKTDGTQTLIITEEPTDDSSCIEKTQSEAQALLDSWISNENASAPLDSEGNPVLQSNINLGIYLET